MIVLLVKRAHDALRPHVPHERLIQELRHVAELNRYIRMGFALIEQGNGEALSVVDTAALEVT